jgi:hypothetical protein
MTKSQEAGKGDAMKKFAPSMWAAPALAAALALPSPGFAVTAEPAAGEPATHQPAGHQPAGDQHGAMQPAAAPTAAPATPAAWNQLRSLVGSWQATHPDGKVTRTTYELVANGSALVEHMATTGKPSMVTVYTLDGSTPMLTHYCSAGNQPRMRALAAANPAAVSFAFVDGGNMASPHDPHMHALKVAFVDADHFTQEWTFDAGGKETTMPFRYERVK